MSYIRVLDEGAAIQDHCVEMNFVGAGVAATRPFTNDRVTVTIPGAGDVAGWTRDILTTTVRLTNVGDAVAVGAALAVGPERLYVAPIGAGPATRFAGESLWPATGVAAGAATQRPSQIVRWTASMWTGAAAVERDYQNYAAPSSLVADETGVARAELVWDYEGFRVLTLHPDTAAPGAIPPMRLLSNGAGFWWPEANRCIVIANGISGLDVDQTPANTVRVGSAAANLSFFGAASGALQQVSGADLTNNVTVGGVNNTIADIVTGGVVGTDIRDALYQLARKLKQINDGLRDYSLFT